MGLGIFRLARLFARVFSKRFGFAKLIGICSVLEAWEMQVCRVSRRVNWVANELAKIAKLDSLDCNYFEGSLVEIDELLLLDTLEAGLG
ncbi:hypothetical protein V6N12_005621 [Hibiscus sabdariffa]|uniref:RNase H type-1 domain-containing protein n=1 Tax=Hibiscus sabdariffa TaxID=183260 RepID=A0ABR2BAF6_9ROSI